MPSVRPQIVFT